MSEVILVALITAVAGPGLLMLLTRLVNRGPTATTMTLTLLDQVQEERDAAKRDLAELIPQRTELRRDVRSLIGIARSLISQLSALGVDTTTERQVVDAIDGRN